MTCSVLSRINALSSVAMYAMAAVAFSAWGTTHYKDKSTETQLLVHRTVLKNIQEFRDNKMKNDAAFLTCDIDFDSKPLWNWNTKQLCPGMHEIQNSSIKTHRSQIPPVLKNSWRYFCRRLA